MRIYIGKRDAQGAGSYMDSKTCLLGTALRRKFPEARIAVSGWTVQINSQSYDFNDKNRIYRAYSNGGYLGKVNLDLFVPFKVTLIPKK